MAELLRTEGLTKRFRGLVANEDINFSLEAGSLRCIIGPNGAGKTTFISMISGHHSPTAGSIWFKGGDITRLPVVRRARMGILRKFQTPTVFDNLSVYDNVELSVLGTNRPRRTRRDRIMSVLDLVRLTDLVDEKATSLSHGQRQWLEIGMLLAQDPKLLLVDEPAAGMTDEETAETSSLLKRIAENHSVVVVEHDMAFVRDLGVKVTVLHEGSVLAEGSLEHVSADPRVIEVYLGR